MTTIQATRVHSGGLSDMTERDTKAAISQKGQTVDSVDRRFTVFTLVEMLEQHAEMRHAMQG